MQKKPNTTEYQLFAGQTPEGSGTYPVSTEDVDATFGGKLLLISPKKPRVRIEYTQDSIGAKTTDGTPVLPESRGRVLFPSESSSSSSLAEQMAISGWRTNEVGTPQDPVQVIEQLSPNGVSIFTTLDHRRVVAAQADTGGKQPRIFVEAHKPSDRLPISQIGRFKGATTYKGAAECRLNGRKSSSPELPHIRNLDPEVAKEFFKGHKFQRSTQQKRRNRRDDHSMKRSNQKFSGSRSGGGFFSVFSRAGKYQPKKARSSKNSSRYFNINGN